MYFVDDRKAREIQDFAFLGQLECEEALLSTDEPLIFMAKSSDDLPLLVYVSAEMEESFYSVVVPFSSERKRQLVEGMITIREALQSSWIWVVEQDYENKVKRAWIVDSLQAIVQTYLPMPEAYLYLNQSNSASAQA